MELKAGEKASAPPVQTELQKNHKELRSYIVVLIQVAILMKMVIYTFGLQYSNNPDEPIYKYLFFTFVSFSFFNMWFFVWRKRTKNNKNKLHEPNQ